MRVDAQTRCEHDVKSLSGAEVVRGHERARVRVLSECVWRVGVL